MVATPARFVTVVSAPQRNALAKYFRGLRSEPHKFFSGPKGLNSEEWIAEGKPFCWRVAEVSGTILVLIDSAYGWLSAFDGDTVLGASISSIVTPNVAILDKDYFSVGKYIWR